MKVKKFRIFTNFEKEEKWLEQMALNGWMLKKQGFLYRFAPMTPQAVNIKIDFRYFTKNEDFQEYLTLFGDSGWRHISGTKISGNQVFMRNGESGDEDIFSDSTSRAGRYKRAANIMLACMIVLLPFIIISIVQGTLFNIDAIINPKVLYFTPGLWERSGSEFWRAFLFETPFALMRGFSGVLLGVLILAYLFLMIRSWITYRRAVSIDE